MTKYVAFLNGINDIGRNPVSMDDLKSHFEALGFRNVITYGQNGNVLFDAEEAEYDAFRGHREPYLESVFGFKIPTVVRRFRDIQSVVENNPFDNVKASETSKWYVTFLSAAPPNEAKGSLGVYSNDSEYARIGKNEIYIYAANYTKTHFSNSYIERKLGCIATTRNWATVNKLLEQQ
jgi:uncharacterized protein (DUF1697 family)